MTYARFKRHPKKDRFEYWKFVYARSSFELAESMAKSLLDGDPNSPDALQMPLLLSLVVFYARPFKQRPAVRLPADVVPPKARDLHDLLIVLRDKMFAHVDVDLAAEMGAEAVDLNKVLLTFEDNNVVSQGFHWVGLSHQMLLEVIELTQALCGKIDYHLEKYSKRLFPDLVGDGEYEINLSDGDDVLLVPFVKPEPGR